MCKLSELIFIREISIPKQVTGSVYLGFRPSFLLQYSNSYCCNHLTSCTGGSVFSKTYGYEFDHSDEWVCCNKKIVQVIIFTNYRQNNSEATENEILEDDRDLEASTTIDKKSELTTSVLLASGHYQVHWKN